MGGHIGNGFSETTLPLLKVKKLSNKAILPSRASPLFAAPRSGWLAWKHSITVGAGVVDADYRGSVGVILFNQSDVDFKVTPGDRIAQLIIERIMTPDVVEVDDLDSTVRGVGGFGSTGVGQKNESRNQQQPLLLQLKQVKLLTG
ncbi:Deoxyuridine 5'-triphosphate nucleotidohydrolase [Acorus calamus]|uniref:Deoxyuridine 5'-triphosphate nucleotidohydrolase n=1 Tax=Acorus calamus TaxID=4465 RepID=A0AAV9EA63_ACOCL|nr:Deoxyuridine 5'-triphosphate nucleotidohydrolase [Acorus calamus]